MKGVNAIGKTRFTIDLKNGTRRRLAGVKKREGRSEAWLVRAAINQFLELFSAGKAVGIGEASMGKMGEKFTFMLDDRVRDRLEEIAAKDETAKSRLVRAALDRYLRFNEELFVDT